MCAGWGGMEDDSDIVIEDVCEAGIWNLGGGLVLMLIKTDILFGEVVVVAVVGVLSFAYSFP